ncbi:methyltransferase domain-containing protein [Lachnospiraceae bacterium 54-53]
MTVILISGVIAAILLAAHYISYFYLKRRIVAKHRWDLNICCGKTDGGGVNADIFKHEEVPNFVFIKDIYHLPFADKEFDMVLCSHTIEHVDDPALFYNELARVGREVTLVIPPLWDICAVFNVFEHRWIFLSFKKVHASLPKYIKLPASSFIQKRLGQKVHA